MLWSNVRLIFLRELRDQLRDRRTDHAAVTRAQAEARGVREDAEDRDRPRAVAELVHPERGHDDRQ